MISSAFVDFDVRVIEGIAEIRGEEEGPSSNSEADGVGKSPIMLTTSSVMRHVQRIPKLNQCICQMHGTHQWRHLDLSNRPAIPHGDAGSPLA